MTSSMIKIYQVLHQEYEQRESICLRGLRNRSLNFDIEIGLEPVSNPPALYDILYGS